MLTIGELIEIPHLRLSLLAGGQGLDRRVTWVHISDLPNPWEWLGESELLLTNGLNLPRDGAAQATFLDTLHAAGVSALAVGSDTPAPPLREELKQRADNVRLAVLAVPYSVPFSAIVRAVADANASEEAQRLTRVARVYELLRLAVARGEPRRTILQRLGSELHCHFHLTDPELGRPLFQHDENTRFACKLAEAYEAHGRMLPGVLHLQDGAIHAMAVSIPGVQPAALVAEPTGERLPELELLQHIATVAALELVGLRSRRERRRRQGAELFSRILEGQLDEESAQRQLSEFGIAGDGAVVLAFRRRGLEEDDSLHHQLSRHGIPHVLLKRDANYCALTPAASTTLTDLLAVLKDEDYAVGVSADMHSLQGASEAAREALWALGVAETEGRQMVRYTDETALLVPRTLEEAQMIVSGVLQPLISHDAANGSELLRTLRVILQADRSWHAAARTLHIHKQTLGYRLRKIEQLTDRRLQSTKDAAELWFAMRAYDLTRGRSTENG